MESVPTLQTESPDYRLASIFRAHNNDVKQVIGTANNSLVTCSRDDTIKVWGGNIYNADVTNLMATYCPSPACAINSIAYVHYKDASYILGGRKDGSIVVYEGNNPLPLVILKAHSMNVCCLHVNTEYSFVVSGGWDHSAIIWSLDSIVNGKDSDYVKLVGHSNSVWALNSFNDIPDSVLTGSADRTIKQWKGDQLVCTYNGHEDVVRSIISMPNGSFYSACNDSVIRCFNRESKDPIHSYKSDVGEFIYSMQKFSFKIGDTVKEFLAASLETGIVLILSIESDGSVSLVTSLMIPNETAWSITAMPNNDLVIGAADGHCYVLTWAAERAASQNIVEVFDASMTNYLTMRAKNKEAQEVVTIKVGLDDGAPAYDLKYKKGTDPAATAEKFISDNNLPISYLDEIIQYITTNIPEARAFKRRGGDNNQPSALPADHFSAGIDRLRPLSSHVPLTSMLMFGDAASVKAVERLTVVNASQDVNMRLDDEQVNALQILLRDPSAPVGQIHIDSILKGLNWQGEELIPILDCLRIGMLNEKIGGFFCRFRGRETFEKLLSILVSDPPMPVRVLVLRCLANTAVLKCSQNFLQNEITLITDLIMKEIQSEKPVLQAAAVAVLSNLALILWNNTEVDKVAELGPREDAMRAVIKAFEGSFTFDYMVPQTLVQIMQAIGTLMWGDASVIRLAKGRNLLKFVTMIKDKISEDSAKDLARDIVEMIHGV